MQKQNEGALFAFSRIGTAFDKTLPYQSQTIFLQIILGGLFVKGYRMLYKNSNTLCCTFLKRIKHQTHYLFLKLIENQQLQADNKFLLDVNEAADSVRKLKQIKTGQPFDYSVLLCFLNEQVTHSLTNKQFQNCLATPNLLPKTGTKEYAIPETKKQQNKNESDCLDVVDGYQLQKIKTIVWNYLDTFGDKFKDNIYHQMAKKGQSTLNIDRIINTVNWIVYTETVDKPYNQLESNNWTCFQAQAKEKCKSDRKEIVFTGSGRILIIPLLFVCKKLDDYKRQCDRQLAEIMQESRKYYLEGEIKAYLITDEQFSDGLVYKTESDTLKRFSFDH